MNSAKSVVKNCFVLLTAVLLPLILLTNSGCQAIRESYARDHSLRRTPRAAAAPRKQQHRRGETGNPLFDRIYGESRRRDEPVRSDLLTGSERSVVSGVQARGDANDDPDVRRIMERRQRSRQEQSDWVFGTKNGSLF